jgi:hypothetical protein
MPRYNCKYLGIELSCDTDFKKVKTFVLQKDMNGVGIEEKKVFVFSNKNGNMIRYTGLESLKNLIGLLYIPKRIKATTRCSDVLSYIVKKHSELFMNGNQIETFGQWTISYCTNKYLKPSSKEIEIKVNNDIIAREGAIGAVRKNAMDYSTALKQELAFRQIKEDRETEEFCKRDIPNGQLLEIPFAPYGQFPNSEEGRKEAVKHSKLVYIRSHLGEGTADCYGINRQKHYVIYSESSGWGKSTFAFYLLKHHNAQIITHVNNFCGIRENIQFLILDEYAGGFSDENLKLITSGDASGFTGNRKSHGKGWTPRSDLQLIFLMNRCLFAYHGDYNNKLQRKVINQSLRDTFNQRFIHVKLDSNPVHDEHVDILRFCPFDIMENHEKIKYFAFEYYVCCVALQRQRLENIIFCCGTDQIGMLEQLKHDARTQVEYDMKTFITKVRNSLLDKNKSMIKMYLYRLQKYINEKLSPYMELPDTELDQLYSIVDDHINGIENIYM